MAGIRRKARELALQVLYQMEITGEPAPTGPESFLGPLPVAPREPGISPSA